jgi:uncharacterized protein
MIIHVKVRPNSREEKIKKMSEDDYTVWLKERPEKGKANTRLIKILAKYFSVGYCNIEIKNPNSRDKFIEIRR